MLDKHIVPVIKPVLKQVAKTLGDAGLRADQTTIIGFLLGLLAVFFAALGMTVTALVMLLLNRLADGIDGELARLQQPTDAGGFLDITLDFIFYAMFPVGFAIADPASNALPAAVLVASFVGTGASFLAFSSMAEKRNISHPEFGYKGLYYLDGLAEGTETIICFVLMCLLPQYFAFIAWLFAAICIVTAINRVVFGYLTLKRST
jgi:phosphatidylglycerophosphate synthase